MFVLPDETVKEIIQGRLNYNDAITNITEEVISNDRAKGFKFEYQARVNLALEKNYVPFCSVLEEECKKEGCVLFKKDGAGKLKKGWVCREYKVDFPEAPFDSRYHAPRIGIDFIDNNKTLDSFEKFRKQGAKYVCLGCHKPYQRKRTEHYEDGHGGRLLEMYVCGSDLFEDIDSFINRNKQKLIKKH